MDGRNKNIQVSKLCVHDFLLAFSLNGAKKQAHSAD